VGFVTAVTSGTGAAFAADHLDPALRTPEEVMLCLELPVLASMPEKIDRRLSD
jgi:capsular polysaccharide biosynthesis protein